MLPRVVTLGLIQAAATPSPPQNLTAMAKRVRLAAKRGAQIICVPELFRSQYFPQTEAVDFFSLAESIPGPTTDVLCPLAREQGVVIVASVFEQRTAGVYHNTVVVIDADGTILGKYRKMHIPDDPYFYEKFYFAPGDLGFRTFSTRYANIGTLICWDQWFPEAARLTALKGAQILVYPTAIGWHVSETRTARKQQWVAWELVQRGHAVANGVYVAAVNRVGREGELKFWGRSFVADPFGEILARGTRDKPETLIVKCDIGRITETRHHWPFLRDRRIDAYHELTQRFLENEES